MKSLKKALTVVLAAALLATAAAGCTQTPASSSAAGSGSATSGGTATTSHKFTAMVTESTNTYCKFADRDKYIAWQALEKMFADKGLEIEFDIVQDDQYATTIATSIASDSDLAEYVSCSYLDDATMISCIDKGIFLPIDDFIQKGDGTAKAFFEKYSFAKKKTAFTDGKMYWIPAVQETYYNGKLASTCTNVLIRYDWVKALGIEVPTKLEDFTAYLQACQDKDLNGNGQKDEYYVAALKDFSSGIPQWFGLPNDRFGLTSDGKVVSTWEMDGVKDYFRYIGELLDKGLISKDYIACESAVTDAANSNNQAASLSSYCMESWLEPEVNVPAGAEAANYVSLMPIQGKEGVNPISNIEPTQLSDWYRAAFTKNLKDKEAAAIFLDIIYSDEYETLVSWGIEGKTFEVKDGIKTLIGDALNGDWKAASLSGECPGDNLWGNCVFPRTRFSDMENEINTISKEKGDAQKEVIDYPYTMIDNMKMYMATASAEEAAVLEKYEGSYKSLSREIAVKIYKGELNIDDDSVWQNEVIKPLKDAGMDELLKTYQARADRFFK